MEWDTSIKISSLLYLFHCNRPQAEFIEFQFRHKLGAKIGTKTLKSVIKDRIFFNKSTSNISITIFQHNGFKMTFIWAIT